MLAVRDDDWRPSDCQGSSDQLLRDKTAGGWLSSPLSRLGIYSKNGVGRTGFEPVTSSVSGNSRTVPGVCHGRAESNCEPWTCTNVLTGSRWVCGHLNTLAPISGSHRLSKDAMGSWGVTPGAVRGTCCVLDVTRVGEAKAGVAGCAPGQGRRKYRRVQVVVIVDLRGGFAGESTRAASWGWARSSSSPIVRSWPVSRLTGRRGLGCGRCGSTGPSTGTGGPAPAWPYPRP